MTLCNLYVTIRLGGSKYAPEGIYVSYILTTDFGAFQRFTTKRRMVHLTDRSVSESEWLTEASLDTRIGALRYNSWQKLIDDEKKFTDDPKWFEKLNTLRRKYPQFDIHND